MSAQKANADDNNVILNPASIAGTPRDPAATPNAPSVHAPPVRYRKLHMGHIAFMRAVVQGLDTRESWNRYLRLEGEHDDIRNVKRTIQWIRDEFAAAAKRSDRPGTARLVQIDANRIAEDEFKVPTLDEFAAEYGLQEFSEAEQLEHYEERHGRATPRQSRRSRLVEKQLEALQWLESLVAQPPQADDAVASWLNPDLARYLEAAGIHSLRQLVERINGIGLRWWAGIRAVGTGKAERILEWLRTHEPTIGLSIGKHVTVKRSSLKAQELRNVVPNATAIVPIEKLVVPSALDGTKGAHRAPQRLCRIHAANDYEAVLAWVKAKQGLSNDKRVALKRKRGIDPAAPEGEMDWLQYLSNTQRAYLKEAERFMLWAIIQRKKPLSSMVSEDCEAYCAFLANPMPTHLWCGPRGREKWSPLWRPFEGPLSSSAQRHAVMVLKSMYQFLVDQCYLIGNPWNAVVLSKDANPCAHHERRFTPAQWIFIEGQLATLPQTSANQRLRIAIDLFYATGLRLQEAVAARAEDLSLASYPATEDNRDPAEAWQMKVARPVDKERIVPVPTHLVADLSRYFAARGLDQDLGNEHNHGAFLLGKAVDAAQRAPWSSGAKREIDPKEGIAPGTLYDQLKAFFTGCAEVLAMTDEQGAQRLRSASTYWLRHTHGEHLVAAGVPLDIVQQNMGHASLSTTTKYSVRVVRGRAEAIEKFWNEKRVLDAG